MGRRESAPGAELRGIGRHSVLLDGLTADPVSPPDGLIWHRADTDLLHAQIDGVTREVLLDAAELAIQIAEGTSDITTTSTSDVLATGMSITPVAGSYYVVFSGAVDDDIEADIFLSIHSAGAQVASSERKVGVKDVKTDAFACVARVTVNGSQAIEGQWRVSTNTGTMRGGRNLAIIKVNVSSVIVEGTSDITTTSVSDVVATGMSITPGAGTYYVIFSGSARNDSDTDLFLSIYSAGSKVLSSERKLGVKDLKEDSFACVARVTVNGAQAIEGRWRVAAGTGTIVGGRNLMIIEVA